MGKTQKVEGSGTRPVRFGRFGRLRRAPEGHQAGLLRVQTQSVLLEPLEEYSIDFVRVLFVLESEDKVVGKPHQKGSPFHARLDAFHIPTVQHVMQVDVRQ